MHGQSLLKINQEKSTTTAFKKLIETSKRKPQKDWSHRGKEFYYKTFLHYLKEQNIQFYLTNSYLKAVFVERFSRTLLDLMKQPLYIEGEACWLNHLDAATEKYNNRVHGTTKMTPFEMSTNNKLYLRNNIIPKALRVQQSWLRIPKALSVVSPNFKWETM